jgi:hypothetical protein
LKNGIPLSEVWRNEIETLKNHENQDHLFRLIAILHTCEILTDKMSYKKINPYKLGSLKIICSYYFAHTYHQVLSIYHLSKIGLGSSGLILTRSIIESLINLAYLWNVKEINKTDNERMAWLEYINVSRYKMDQAWKEMQKHRENKGLKIINPVDIFLDEVSQNLTNEMIEFRNKYKRDHWAIINKIEQRARKVDDLQKLANINLEEIYHSCYRWTSEIVHGTSGGSSLYFEDSERSFNVDFGANFKDVGIVIPMASHMMLEIIEIVNHLFNLEVNLLDQLKSSGYRGREDFA